MATFPVLYGSSIDGKVKMWSVAVEDRGAKGAAIITTHGYADGKKQTNERVVTEGKNVGKRNETTPLQQAINEAHSDWNKKRDAKYTEELPSAGGAGADAPFAPPLPMLAHKFTDRGKDIRYPCYAQRKLDGVRCLAIAGHGLYSRLGKPFSAHLAHIRTEINRLPSGTILDGELYSDTVGFQEIVGLVKKETLKAGDAEKIKSIFLWVYDTVREGSNRERKRWLDELFASYKFASSVRLLPSVVCNSETDAMYYHAQFVAAGYEGLILRNAAGVYRTDHRSADLQKYKEFDDAEFTITGYEEGDGVEKGCVVWKCATDAGATFDCRPRGTREERAALFRDGAAYVGKKLTVRYQGFTDDGKPRFPVGVAIRTYE
jgi:DNA ligase-1